MPSVDVAVPLYGLTEMNEPINLSDNVTIRPLDDVILRHIDRAIETGFSRVSAPVSGYAFISDYYSDDRPVLSARSVADALLLSLRLLKRGDVGFSLVFSGEHGWCNEGEADSGQLVDWLALHHYVVWKRPHHSIPYSLTRADIVEIKYLLEAIDIDTLCKPAFRHFFRSYHEPYATDRFLTCAIGLECMLLNDQQEKTGIAYKFRDRGAFLLQRANPCASGATEYFNDLRKVYNERSRLVHAGLGAANDWSTEKEMTLLTTSEEYLRMLLKLVLSHPEWADSSNVDIAKISRY